MNSFYNEHSLIAELQKIRTQATNPEVQILLDVLQSWVFTQSKDPYALSSKLESDMIRMQADQRTDHNTIMTLQSQRYHHDERIMDLEKQVSQLKRIIEFAIGQKEVAADGLAE